jgi:hypothetical protein
MIKRHYLPEMMACHYYNFFATNIRLHFVNRGPGEIAPHQPWRSKLSWSKWPCWRALVVRINRSLHIAESRLQKLNNPTTLRRKSFLSSASWSLLPCFQCPHWNLKKWNPEVGSPARLFPAFWSIKPKMITDNTVVICYMAITINMTVVQVRVM